MTALERTAYPRFKCRPSAKELELTRANPRGSEVQAEKESQAAEDAAERLPAEIDPAIPRKYFTLNDTYFGRIGQWPWTPGGVRSRLWDAGVIRASDVRQSTGAGRPPHAHPAAGGAVHLVEVAHLLAQCDMDYQFELGLDLILSSLEARLS